MPPNGQKFHDSLLLINTFLRLKLSSELLNQFKEKIHSELGSEWQQYLEHDIEVPDISSEESQKEFFKVYVLLGNRIINEYSSNKLNQFLDRDLKKCGVKWLIDQFVILGQNFSDLGWNNYQNLFFLGTKITDYQGNSIPDKKAVWYPMRTIFSGYFAHGHKMPLYC